MSGADDPDVRSRAMKQMTDSAGFDRNTAIAMVVGALVVSGLVSRRYSPDPTHPRLRRWYKSLDKPNVTPPDAVFGAAWPVLLTGLGAGTYRFLRQPPAPSRNAAIALAGLTLAMVTGYSKIAFGDRNLTRGTAESQALVGVACAYVAVASASDRRAAALGAPLLFWSIFGSWLTAQLRRRNPGLDSGARTTPGRVRLAHSD